MILELVACDRCGAEIVKRLPGSTALPSAALVATFARQCHAPRHYCSPACAAAAIRRLRANHDPLAPQVSEVRTGDGAVLDIGRGPLGSEL